VSIPFETLLIKMCINAYSIKTQKDVMTGIVEMTVDEVTKLSIRNI
jgi:hypothetical protein